MPAPNDSIAITSPVLPDTLAADTVASDTLQAKEVFYGIVLEKPHQPEIETVRSEGNGISWFMSGLLLLFVIICFRYRKNTRYFTALIDELTEVRVRHNAFDDTVRETTFMLLLNLMWSFCIGVLLYEYIALSGGSASMQARGSDDMALGMVICAGVAAAYTVCMTLLYYTVGNVFSDAGRASLWVKGYLSSQGLDVLAMFPLAMLAFVLPQYVSTLLIVGGIAFVATKIIFIYKGFRIFFTQTASWVLFLYYLCSLEIVPLILAYVAASFLCALP